MCIPGLGQVMASHATVKRANWRRHREDPRYGQPYPHHDEYADGSILTRADVFGHFGQSIRKGIISAVKWGYPRGRMPGGRWQPFSCVFRTAAFGRIVEEVRSADSPQPATTIITTLNGVLPRIGTATTSKLAYFAGLTATEGPCLIYDAMVRRAIRVRSDPEFKELKSKIARRARDLLPAEQASTYGLYLQATHAMANRLGVQGEQVELFLFLGRANASALCLTP